jgi:hypothetical protein
LFIAAINDSDAARLLSAAQIANRVRPSQAAKTLVWEKIYGLPSSGLRLCVI